MAFFTKKNAAKFGRRGGIAARAVSGRRTGRLAGGKAKAEAYRSTERGRRTVHYRYKRAGGTDRGYGQVYGKH